MRRPQLIKILSLILNHRPYNSPVIPFQLSLNPSVFSLFLQYIKDICEHS